jgi:hypothetical protein
MGKNIARLTWLRLGTSYRFENISLRLKGGNKGNFLTSKATVSYARKALLHGA